MTEREEIDMLRRLVADLTERVRTLEAKGSPATHVITGPNYTITPMRGPLYGPAGDPPSTGTPVPFRMPSTCMATASGKTALWHGEA